MAPRRVVVTGAGGRTGQLVLQKLAERPELFQARGTARTAASAAEVSKKTGAPCAVCDVTDPSSVDEALRAVDTLVILSSATPKPNWLKLMGFFCKKFCLCKSARMGEAFEYPKNGEPKRVDWEGVRNLVDGAKRAGVKHVIIVGSMGGTRVDHFLNKMGGGNILLWKRKAEIYLIKSGLPYTVIHPGGLLPHMGNKVVPGGQRELLVGVDDELMDTKSHCIPREDVAEVVAQCALEPAAIGRSFDLASKEPGVGTVWNRDVKALLETLGDKNCDFSKPEHPILDS